MAGKLKVTQTKSTISHIARNRATIKALGLHGIGSTSIITDNEATRGLALAGGDAATDARALRARPFSGSQIVQFHGCSWTASASL